MQLMIHRGPDNKMAQLHTIATFAIALLATTAFGCGKATPAPPIDRFDPAAIGAKVPQDSAPTDPAKLDARYLDKDGLVRRRLTRPEVVALLSSGVQVDFISSIPDGWNGIQYFAQDGRWRGTRPMSGGDFVGRYVIRKDGAYCWVRPNDESATNCYAVEIDIIGRYYMINSQNLMGQGRSTVHLVKIKQWNGYI